MTARLLRALLCVLIVSAFTAPPASAGVFQLVEINGGALNEGRINAGGDNGNSGDAPDDDDAEEGSRAIQPSQSDAPGIQLDILGYLFRMIGVDRR